MFAVVADDDDDDDDDNEYDVHITDDDGTGIAQIAMIYSNQYRKNGAEFRMLIAVAN